MKSLTSLCTLIIAGLTLAAPASVFAGHHSHSSGNYCHSGGGVYISGARGFYGGGYGGYVGGYGGYGGGYGYRPYCAPVAYRPYCAPSYYGGSAISIGFSTAPAYYGGDYGSGSYYDSYPTRAVYRGVPVSGYGYRERARYDGDLAVDVQRALARRGFYRGGIDGDVGPGTRAAIRSYQYSRGFEVTGRIDGSLLRSLSLS